jgi:predicted unusual protein kinase regulating ubiquinone biosynthesis (AarF/ABC1/UbiB family)
LTALLHDDLQPSPRPTVLQLGRVGPQDLGRLVEITSVLARHGVVTVARSGSRFALHPRRQPPKALAVALRRSFAELGPTFTKLGQLIASSPGLFPEVLSDELRRLLDDVPAEPAYRIRRTVERELRTPLELVFARFDDEPLAAASVAQVHRARLHDGTEVVVKVRRPHLRHRIERDLRLLRLVAVALSRMGAIGEALNPVAIVDDLAQSMHEELDFRREARDMAQFAANLATFGSNDRIVVPTPIEELVRERVLVMTYVEGIPVDRGDELRAAGHDLTELVRMGARAWIESALVHGLFHGDVHAGNLFVTPAGEVAFLDFGIVGRLDDRVREVLRRTLPAMVVGGDLRAAVAALADLGAVRGPIDLDRAGDDIAALVGPLMELPLSEISYGEILSDVLQVATAHRIQLPREMVAVVKQLVYFERYVKDLAPDYQMLTDPEILQHLLA